MCVLVCGCNVHVFFRPIILFNNNIAKIDRIFSFITRTYFSLSKLTCQLHLLPSPEALLKGTLCLVSVQCSSNSSYPHSLLHTPCLKMADNPTDIPPAEEAVTDSFGPPHGHAVSDSLHLWIILPGLVLVAFIGE